MPNPPTTRLGLVLPSGSDSPPDVAGDYAAAFSSLDALVAIDDQGVWPPPTATAERRGTYYWATDRGRLYRCVGTDWLEVDNLPSGSTLPSDSWDGMRFAWRPTADLEWPMVRRGSVWRFHGGAPLVVSRTTAITINGGSAAHVLTATPPAAGNYDVEISLTANLPLGTSSNTAVDLVQGTGTIGLPWKDRSSGGGIATLYPQTIAGHQRLNLAHGPLAVKVTAELLTTIVSGSLRITPVTTPVVT